MDGITNNAYRMICKYIRENPKNEHNKYFRFWRFIEFMTADGYVRNPAKVTRHLLTTQGETDIIAQIYGGNHETLLQTAIDVDHKYTNSFSGIELNIGCPSPSVMGCEAGSGMLKCRPKTLQIIKDISGSIQKPFSIKTRSGLNQDDRQEQFDFIIESAYYCKTISIHGRTYKQSHSGEVDRDFILKIKQELIKRDMGDVNIIGNGGLKSVSDGLQYLRNTSTGGIDGLMFGQAAMCNPWSMTSYTPDIHELYDITIKHLHLCIANEIYFANPDHFDSQTNTLIQPQKHQLDELIQQLIAHKPQPLSSFHSVIEFRKHLFRYVNGLVDNKEFKRKAATIPEYGELLQHINDYFLNLISCL